MITVERATRIAASASRVWQLFSTEDGQRRAEAGLVASMTFEGEGVGLIRTLHPEGQAAGQCVKERLEHYDEANREMAFRIVDTGDIVPFADHLGFAKVIPAGETACVLLMRLTFVPVDIGVDQALAIAEENCRLFIANVRTAVAEEFM